MNRAKLRVIIVVLDGVGVGAMPDANLFHDAGSNTLEHLVQAVPSIKIPHLIKLGLDQIVPFLCLKGSHAPRGAYGRLRTINKAKDTICGHWEIAGIVQDPPFQTYPKGFPVEIVNEWCQRCGIKGVLGNRTASGTVIIEELGREHMKTGFPILYTSADSVFQVAAHEEVISLKKLYDICSVARDLLKPPHLVARVIARPFTGEPGSFQRTDQRRDFSITPPGETLLDQIQCIGAAVVAIGKIDDIFCRKGITHIQHTRNNTQATEAILRHLANGIDQGLIFANLGDFDTLYGHRRDPNGFALALEHFDETLPSMLGTLRDEDVLIITADHGCDPTWADHTDHTREEVPILISGKCIRHGYSLGVRDSLSDISATILDAFDVAQAKRGKSFWREVKRT